MKTLLLSHNPSLNGSLPGAWATGLIAGNLVTLDLRATSLSGPLSASWTGANLHQLTCFAVDAPGMCGVIPGGLPCFMISGTHLGNSLVG